MNMKLFMLCTLGFMGLQGAQAGTRVTAHGDKVTVERVAPEYDAGGYSAQPSAPMAISRPQTSKPVDLSNIDRAALMAELVRRETETFQGEFEADVLARTGRTVSSFRTQGPLQIPPAGRHRSAPATLPDVARLRLATPVFDSTDSEGDHSPRPTPPTHRRQRSWSADATPTQQADAAAQQDGLERWPKTTDLDVSTPLADLAAGINSPFNAIALAAVRAFTTYETHVLAGLHEEQLTLRKLFHALCEKQKATVTPCEPAVRLVPKAQKATDNLQRGTIKISREMQELSQQIAAATERLEKKKQKLAAKKK